VNVADLRSRLGLNQTQFAQLFGVHPMTVSKWERNPPELNPTPYQHALMTEFLKAAKNKEVQEKIGAVLIGAGIAAALLLLLKNAK
jgi:hypothetical protein